MTEVGCLGSLFSYPYEKQNPANNNAQYATSKQEITTQRKKNRKTSSRNSKIDF